MNPYSPEQKYPKAIIKHAHERCLSEKDNVHFLIQHKSNMHRRVSEAIEAFDNEFGREPIVVGNGIILPSPVELFEEEARYHAETLDQQKMLLTDITEAEKSIENAVRRHKQNYDFKYERFLESQRRRKLKINSASNCSHD